MRVFQFLSPSTSIEALVLAPNEDDATELFEEHALARGGDPDTKLWREHQLHHLEDDTLPAVRAALKLDREGLVVCENLNRWVFITPV